MCLAIPGKITSIAGDDPLSRTATVDFAGVQKNVSLACLPDARVGNFVMVHVGIALCCVDEHEANEVFDYLRRMEEALKQDGP
jgi:hydrogenase expression/formation protein HypC